MKSKGFANEIIKLTSLLDNHLAPSLSNNVSKTRVKYVGSCLKRGKVTFTHGKIINVYIVFEINLWYCGYDDWPTLKNCLFNAVKLIRKCWYWQVQLFWIWFQIW